jgi:hypothetical protein
MPPERRVVFGVRPNTVRLSAGIEKTEHLLEDLEQALSKVKVERQPEVRAASASKTSDKKGTGYANLRV